MTSVADFRPFVATDVTDTTYVVRASRPPVLLVLFVTSVASLVGSEPGVREILTAKNCRPSEVRSVDFHVTAIECSVTDVACRSWMGVGAREVVGESCSTTIRIATAPSVPRMVVLLGTTRSLSSSSPSRLNGSPPMASGRSRCDGEIGRPMPNEVPHLEHRAVSMGLSSRHSGQVIGALTCSSLAPTDRDQSCSAAKQLLVGQRGAHHERTGTQQWGSDHQRD